MFLYCATVLSDTRVMLVMLLEIHQLMMGFNAACTASALWSLALDREANPKLLYVGRDAFTVWQIRVGVI